MFIRTNERARPGQQECWFQPSITPRGAQAVAVLCMSVGVCVLGQPLAPGVLPLPKGKARENAGCGTVISLIWVEMLQAQNVPVHPRSVLVSQHPVGGRALSPQCLEATLPLLNLPLPPLGGCLSWFISPSGHLEDFSLALALTLGAPLLLSSLAGCELDFCTWEFNSLSWGTFSFQLWLEEPEAGCWPSGSQVRRKPGRGRVWGLRTQPRICRGAVTSLCSRDSGCHDAGTFRGSAGRVGCFPDLPAASQSPE